MCLQVERQGAYESDRRVRVFSLNKLFNLTESCTISTSISFRSILEPWISCPAHINVVLKPGMNTSDVGDKWTLPTSNVKNITAVDPPGVSGSYQFPAGSTMVKWVAINEIGEQDYCVAYVNVKGKYVSSICIVDCHPGDNAITV